MVHWVLGQCGAIWRRKIDGDTNRPTNQHGECSALCLFEDWKIEGRDLQLEKQEEQNSYVECNRDRRGM